MNQVNDCSSQVEEERGERRRVGERSCSLAQEKWARRFRWRNHVVTAVAARGFEVSCWRSVEGTCCLSCQRSCVKRGQLSITCLAVSHCHPQGHAGHSYTMPEHSAEFSSPCRVSAMLPHSSDAFCAPPCTLTPRYCFGAPGAPARNPHSNCSLHLELVVCSPSLHSIRTGMRIRPLGPYRQSRSRPRPYLHHCHYMPRLAALAVSRYLRRSLVRRPTMPRRPYGPCRPCQHLQGRLSSPLTK